MQSAGMSLIVNELEKHLPNMKLISYSDVYPNKQEIITIDYDHEFIDNLIGKKYEESEIFTILNSLGIKKQ
jgi:phenylalanyl-tRNA synthetase beta subunit